VQDGHSAAAPIARHRPVRDGLQLDPYPGSAAIAAGFIALCSYDRVPLPNAEPTDKLRIGQGGLQRLLVGFATSSLSKTRLARSLGYRVGPTVIPEIPDEPFFSVR
jgi:hypothetical protein